MRRIFSLALIMVAAATAGCGNLSPRDNFSPQMQQELRDIKDSQANLENIQNGIKIELGRLQNALAVEGENNEVQQGWLNIKADGIVIGGFALAVIGMLLYYMYLSSKYKKVAEIMSGQIRAYDDGVLREKVMAAAWNTNVERTIFKMID